MVYTEDQIDRYLERIQLPRSQHAADPLELLAQLQKHQLTRIPFESTALHYTTHRSISVELDDVFDKAVVRGKGGYCMELNALFGAVLKTLGFTLISCCGRVKAGGYVAWGHMVNLVTIDGQRYLVDVGFGSGGSTRPMPLISGHEVIFASPRRGKLEYRALKEHTDPNQRLWVYSAQDNADAPWAERYCFTETECFIEDYRDINYSTSHNPTSLFVKEVVAMKFILDETTDEIGGTYTLFRTDVKKTWGSKSEVVETMKNEEERLAALKKYFSLDFAVHEKRGIKGLPSELKEQKEQIG